MVRWLTTTNHKTIGSLYLITSFGFFLITILGLVNLIATIICMRAPGMTMFRMPIFTWNVLLTGVLVLMAFPYSPPRCSRSR